MLRKLVALAEARRARDLTRLDALTAERRRLEAEIVELARIEARDAAEGVMPFAMLARRTVWAAAEIARRESRTAAITSEIEVARTAARTSLGKHEALIRLTEAAACDEAAARARTEERVTLAARNRR